MDNYHNIMSCFFFYYFLATKHPIIVFFWTIVQNSDSFILFYFFKEIAVCKLALEMCIPNKNWSLNVYWYKGNELFVTRSEIHNRLMQ